MQIAEVVTRYEKMKCVLGLPSVGHHSTYFSMAKSALVFPSMFAYETCPIIGEEVGLARNLIAHHAEKIGADYIAFLDEDVIPQANAFAFLLYFMENHPEVSVVGGVYATKGIPSTPLVYKEWCEGPYYGWKAGEVFPVKATGLGLTVIRVKDLAKIDVETYPARNSFTGEHTPDVKRYFMTGTTTETTDTGVKVVTWTEDTYFFYQCDQAGLSVYCDGRVIADHYDWKTNQMYHVPLDSNICKEPNAWERSPRIANLGCGADAQDTMVNVDLNSEDQRVFKCDIQQLPVEWGEQFDTVRAYHCLEHIPYEQTERTLSEWIRILKPGGILNIRVPDFEWVARRVLDTEGEMDIVTLGNVFGDQYHPYWKQKQYSQNAHLTAFTRKSLTSILEKIGLTNVKAESNGFDFSIVAWKPGEGAAVPSLEAMQEAVVPQ